MGCKYRSVEGNNSGKAETVREIKVQGTDKICNEIEMGKVNGEGREDKNNPKLIA